MTTPQNSTARWGGIEEQAGLLAFRVGAWNELGYTDPEEGQAAIPPLGERSAEAITAGHAAVETIDEMIRDLHSLRAQLVTELRQNQDILMDGTA
jgi:hypothetical protein